MMHWTVLASDGRHIHQPAVLQVKQHGQAEQRHALPRLCSSSCSCSKQYMNVTAVLDASAAALQHRTSLTP
jgi:hypothetical protein